jgi:hypothetical protein
MPEARKQEIGQPVLPFRLPLLDGGGSRSLEEVLVGKRGALITFWSSVCSHCVRYDRYFNGFAQAHPELGFTAIASRVNETAAQMLSAMHERGLSFPILLDHGGTVARLWYSQQTPRCYLIDPDLRLMYRGAIDNFRMPREREYVAWLEPAITSFLAGETIARPETASFGCAIETVYFQLPPQLS